MKSLLLATSALIGALVPAAAFAEADAAPSAVEGVVVTGRPFAIEAEVAGRLGLTERETPATIDIITQQDMQAQGLRNAIETMNAAPGVASGNLPGSVGSVSMRGFHRAVNYLYDGVRVANSDAGVRNWDAWSFERIEVIKGPASVTSGEGALAGAINFVPRRPVLGKMFGEAFASVGSQNSYRIAGDLNAPLSDNAAVRGDLVYSSSDGWVDDTDSQAFGANLAVLLRPSDALSVTLSADYYEDEFTTAYYGSPLVPATSARRPSSIVSGSGGLVFDEALRDRNYDVEDGRMDSQSVWLRARADYQLNEAWKIVSDTSWYTADRLWRDSDDYSFNSRTGLIDRLTSLISHDHQIWNQRLNATYDGALAGRRNRFTAGVEFGGTDFFTKRRFGSTTSVDPYAPVRGLFPADTPANFTTRQNVSAEVESRAVFVEDAYNLTPELLLVAGARWDSFSLDRRVLNVTSSAIQAYSQDYDPVSWRIGAVYSLRPQTQLYGQFTRAATPISGILFMSATNASFEVSMGESYEVGIKTSLLDDRLQLTASVFDIRQDDILTRDPANPAVTVQGGSQTSRGIEVSLDWSVTDELRLELGASALDAEFDRLIEAGGANRSGNRPANTPEQLVDLVATYSPNSLPLTFTGAVRHNGDFFTSNANTVKVDGFTTLDASVTWQAPFGSVSLRGRNLTDELYADWSGYSSYLVFIGQPRSFELSLSRKF
ncbi:TonB-dependent receptor [Phenylobacterium sp. Root77]|uniref:TonB-dependent receptor n=1 Tax=unclassified Phenylobacterium TaxID=2640670 RepID=UPI0006FE84EA|nr:MULTISPECIES: TonB-dependent receptor [unclassified Phenylobacterium]KQW71900.1 TonB-dependent receptor [Phenylobacterium sp. Root1277]KQW94821.1 TonB-dependent receptor [Phenylobacterium sp. Root1290]KRC44515.1 TonB-dependent receptor [Phenylobacterium sp. Root77]